MKQIFAMLMIALLAIFPVSCTSKDVKEKLAVSEEIIMSEPDSALTLIKSINTEQLRTSKEKAMYGLLYTMSMVKTHEPVVNDTIIDYSVDYFRRKADKKHLAMSLYYQGAVLYQKDLPYQALISYLHALDAAEEIYDNFYIGLACRGISDIYCDSFNSGDELVYAKREYENFKAAGIQPFVNYAMLDLERAYHNNEQFDEVYKLTEQIKDSASVAKDQNLLEESLRICASSYIGDGKSYMAVRLFKFMCQNNMSCAEDSAFMTIAYALTGNSKEASRILATTNFEKPLLKEAANFHVSEIQGKTDKALYHSKKADSITNKLLQEKFEDNFSTIVSYNYQTQIKQNRENLNKSKIILWSFITIGILIISIICFLSITHIRKQKQDIDNKILYAEQLQEALHLTENENKASSKVIKDLISSKYEMLDKLCNIVASNPDNKIARKKIADEVNNFIDTISLNGDNMQKYANEVDRMFNNIYSNLKRDFPELKDIDCHLFILSALGFKPTAIGLFLKEEKINAVYERKRRLKNKIKKSDKPLTETYLQFLN